MPNFRKQICGHCGSGDIIIVGMQGLHLLFRCRCGNTWHELPEEVNTYAGINDGSDQYDNDIDYD